MIDIIMHDRLARSCQSGGWVGIGFADIAAGIIRRFEELYSVRQYRVPVFPAMRELSGNRMADILARKPVSYPR